MLLFSSSIISTCQVLVNSFHFQTECCPNSVILIPWLYHCGSLFFWFISSCFMSFNLQGSHNVHCSSFYRSALNFVHLRCILSFKIVQPLRFVVSLVCQRSNFVLSLLFHFYPVLSLGSRVEILC